MVKDSSATALVKTVRAPSTPVDLGRLADDYPGGVCDAVILTVPAGLGQAVLESILGAAAAAGATVTDQRTETLNRQTAAINQRIDRHRR